MWLLIVVKTVGTQHSQQRKALHLWLGDVSEIDTRRVALELHVKSELLFLYRRGKIVDVLHHQIPVSLCGIV